jgi:hypothetical protein
VQTYGVKTALPTPGTRLKRECAKVGLADERHGHAGTICRFRQESTAWQWNPNRSIVRSTCIRRPLNFVNRFTNISLISIGFLLPFPLAPGTLIVVISFEIWAQQSFK